MLATLCHVPTTKLPCTTATRENFITLELYNFDSDNMYSYLLNKGPGQAGKKQAHIPKIYIIAVKVFFKWFKYTNINICE